MARSIDYEVFISHATEDRKAASFICETLEREGLRCWIAPRDMPGGTEWGASLLDAILCSRMLVLLLSTAANESVYVYREVERAVSNGKPVLPVRLEDVSLTKKLEFFVASTHWIDAFSSPFSSHLPELVSAAKQLIARQQLVEATDQAASLDRPTDTNAAKALRVALLYKRRAQPDEKLLNLLESHLTAAGHSVFIDRHMSIGVEWAKQIEQEIRGADAVVTLLSPASVNSEMLAYEVEIAHQAAQENAGKPRLFPVRINFEGALPPDLAGKLNPLHYFLWRNPEDDTSLVKELLHALTRPSRVPPTPIGDLERVGGAVPLDSRFYVERPTDAEFQTAIRRRDMIVLVKGARQMGKTSLLARGMETARQNGVRVVLTDLQKLTTAQFQSLDSFFQAVGELLADQLDLEVLPQDVWRPQRSPNVNFERYVRKEVLANLPGQLLWAMDEVDRLFSCSFSGDVFALFRTWFNECALDASKPWSRLTLAIAYATEAHLFISDPNQSPFNVGTKLTLDDFTREQVADLNRRYGSPLGDAAELRRFYELVGGQPYLVRRSLHELVSRGTSIDEFAVQADHDDGPLGDHLRRILVLLARDPGLCEAMHGILRGQPCPDYGSFYRLRSAGILSGESRDTARPRCGIYATYLVRHLS